jgi:flagellar basal-body rod modification protein FlgD
MTTTTNPAQGASAAGSNALSSVVGANGDVSQMFTTLLIAQIKNQDPLQPTDPSQFVSQLTELSQLQSLQTLSTQGSTNASMLQSLQTLALGADVGSQVSASTGSVVLNGKPVQGHFNLQSSDSAVSVVLTGASGLQKVISLGSQAQGVVPFTIDPEALGLPAGTYSVSVTTASGSTPAAEIVGTITSVNVSSSQGVVLDVSNLGEISSSDITSFDGRPAAGGG